MATAAVTKKTFGSALLEVNFHVVLKMNSLGRNE